MPSPSFISRLRDFPPPWSPRAVTLFLLCAGLIIAPFTFFDFDFRGCWLPWGRATGGTNPLAVYGAGCNYPPFVPYLLTLAEGARRLLGAAREGPVAVFLVKIPSILAYGAAIPLCLRWLPRPLGASGAGKAALCYALTVPLWINAVVWGQFDALLSLAILGAVIALWNERPLLAGAAMGLALAIKLQAIIAVPALAVFLARRFGLRALLVGTALGLLVLGVVAAPYLGDPTARKGVIASYGGAVGQHPQRSISAYNGWYLLDGFDAKVRKLGGSAARSDMLPAIGPITYRQLGLGAFALYTLGVMFLVWRRPDPHFAVVGMAMNIFAFFMLPTQMHERYVIPGVALLALLAWRYPRIRFLFLSLCVTASLNQLIAQYRHNFLYSLTPLTDAASLGLAGLVALAHIGLFVWATIAFVRGTLLLLPPPSAREPEPDRLEAPAPVPV